MSAKICAPMAGNLSINVTGAVRGTPLTQAATYSLTSWLRSDQFLTVRAHINEYGPTGAEGGSDRVLVLTGNWVQVSTMWAVSQPDSTSLNVVFASTGAAGDCFELDDVCLQAP